MLCRYKIKYLRDDFISSNNLDAIRLLAATLVVYGHSFSISSVNGYSDILKSIGFLGSHVVGLYIFFLISGFLITLSIERKNDPVDFIKARVLRLVPGMIVSTCLTLIMVAPFSSLSITEFLASKEAVKYVVMNSSLLDMRGGGSGYSPITEFHPS